MGGGARSADPRRLIDVEAEGSCARSAGSRRQNGASRISHRQTGPWARRIRKCGYVDQEARQQSRPVGAGRWTNLEHERLVKLFCFSRQCWRCRHGYGRHRSGHQRRERQGKRRARAGHHHIGVAQTAGYRYPCLRCGGRCVCVAGREPVGGHASFPSESGDRVLERKNAPTAVSDHTCLPTSVCLTVVAELSEVGVQTSTFNF